MANGAQFYEVYILSMPLIIGATAYTGGKVREATSRWDYWNSRVLAYTTAASVLLGYMGAFIGLANGGAGPIWDPIILYTAIFNVAGLVGAIAAQGHLAERPPRLTEQAKVENSGDEADQSKD